MLRPQSHSPSSCFVRKQIWLTFMYLVSFLLRATGLRNSRVLIASHKFTDGKSSHYHSKQIVTQRDTTKSDETQATNDALPFGKLLSLCQEPPCEEPEVDVAPSYRDARMLMTSGGFNDVSGEYWKEMMVELGASRRSNQRTTTVLMVMDAESIVA